MVTHSPEKMTEYYGCYSDGRSQYPVWNGQGPVCLSWSQDAGLCGSRCAVRPVTDNLCIGVSSAEQEYHVAGSRCVVDHYHGTGPLGGCMPRSRRCIRNGCWRWPVTCPC